MVIVGTGVRRAGARKASRRCRTGRECRRVRRRLSKAVFSARLFLRHRSDQSSRLPYRREGSRRAIASPRSERGDPRRISVASRSRRSRSAAASTWRSNSVRARTAKTSHSGVTGGRGGPLGEAIAEQVGRIRWRRSPASTRIGARLAPDTTKKRECRGSKAPPTPK